jgi:hypothetical protein
MLIEPLGDVDVNVPGVMAMLVAPATDQLSVLLAPELMLVGSAVKEVIEGMEPFPEDAFDGVDTPHPASPAQAKRMRTSEQRASPEELSSGDLRSLRTELVESMGKPQRTQSIAHAAVAIALRGPSPLDHISPFVHRVLGVIRRSTFVREQSVLFSPARLRCNDGSY